MGRVKHLYEVEGDNLIELTQSRQAKYNSIFFLISFFFQAVRVELVQFLLTILDSLLSEVKNPSGTKAQIVKALKAMCRDLNQGEQVKFSFMI